MCLFLWLLLYRRYNSRQTTDQLGPINSTVFRTYKRVFLFHQNFVPDFTKIQEIQEGLSFPPEFYPRPYQNSGHTGGSFFFTRILSPTLPKFRSYRRVFPFYQNFVPDFTKIQDIQEGLSFSPEICPRPYQNSGHTGGYFFFTRILSLIVPKFTHIFFFFIHAFVTVVTIFF